MPVATRRRGRQLAVRHAIDRGATTSISTGYGARGHECSDGGRLTLEQRLDGVWEGLHAAGAADCPVCGSRMDGKAMAPVTAGAAAPRSADGEARYAAIASLDGYVADESGNWDWSMPDAEVHAFVNDLERGIGTYLYGRRMYEVLVAWETLEDDDPVARDYAEVWRAADKVVYSRTLDAVSSERTRIEREFEPHAVRR